MWEGGEVPKGGGVVSSVGLKSTFAYREPQVEVVSNALRKSLVLYCARPFRLSNPGAALLRSKGASSVDRS